jgi:hypothetical protein
MPEQTTIIATSSAGGVELAVYGLGGALVVRKELTWRRALLLGVDLVNLACDRVFRADQEKDPPADARPRVVRFGCSVSASSRFSFCLGLLIPLGRLIHCTTRPCGIQRGFGFLQHSLPITPIHTEDVSASPLESKTAAVQPLDVTTMGVMAPWPQSRLPRRSRMSTGA